MVPRGIVVCVRPVGLERNRLIADEDSGVEEFGSQKI